jgi:hypothetical protein
MKKLLSDFFSENGQGSSKRLIGIGISCVLAWGIIFAFCKSGTDTARQALINSTMIFVLVMSGVATVAQIVTLIRGGSPAKDEGNTIDKPKTD